MRSLCFPFIGFFAATAASALSIEALDYDAEDFRRLQASEIAFRLNASFDNPFDPGAIAVEAVLRGPAGETRTVPAFLHQDFAVDHEARTVVREGEPGWVARVTPLRTGSHELSIRASVDGGEARTLTTFEVDVARAPEAAEGFIQIDADNPSYFSRSESGRTFWPLGYNMFHMALPPGPQFVPGYRSERFDREVKPTLFLSLYENGSITPEARYQVYLDLMTRLEKTADAGATALRIRLDSWWQFLEVYPDAKLPGGEAAEASELVRELYPIGRYDPFNAWLADEMMRMAERENMGAILCLWNGQAASEKRWATEPYWAPGEEDEALIQRKIRYSVARWSASPALWTWEYFNEVSGKQNLPVEINGPFWSRMTEYFQAIDPYDHLINNGREHIEYYDFHRYPNDNVLGIFYDDARALSKKHSMPVILGEIGVGVDKVIPSRRDLTGNSFRQRVWRMMTSGNGGLLFWRYHRMEAYDLYDEVFTLPRLMIDRLDFANHEWSYPEVDAMDSGMVYRAMRNTEGTALVYAQRTPIVADDAASAWVDKAPTEAASAAMEGMPAGLYQVTWYAPTDGDVLLATTLAAQGNRLEFPTPAGVSRDAVLLVEPVR